LTPLLLVSLLAVPPDTLVVGILTDPVTLEPHRATDLVSTAVVANVCETLVHFRSGGTRPEGVLATTWATVDRRVWTFTLREGVRFHDGAALDAEAVVANLESLRRTRAFPGRASRIGPHVVSITLDKDSVRSATNPPDTLTGTLRAQDADGIDSVWLQLDDDPPIAEDGLLQTSFQSPFRVVVPAGFSSGARLPVTLEARDVTGFRSVLDTMVRVAGAGP